MNGKTTLKRLERRARLAQQKAQDDAQRIRTIEVWDEDRLLEVITLGRPAPKVIAVVNVDLDRV